MIKKMFLVLALVLASGCSLVESDTFESEYVVESYLFAGDPLPDIRLSQTVPFGTAYVFEQQAVANATVELSLLASDNSIEQTFAYAMGDRGIYQSSGAAVVQPQRSYRLRITFPDDETVVTSTTTIPDTFSIITASTDTVIFASTERLEIDVTESVFPGRQNIFIFSTEAFDVSLDNLTPLLDEFFDEEEDDLEEFRINESPPINEGNYDRNPDGSLTINLPWIAINFYGANRIRATAIDDNILDFVQSVSTQTQGSTLSPGEVPNIIDNIENGTGVFGSYALVETDLFVKRPF
ncbi:MAG: DUF4249 family protein [Calditrichia bacterium]